MKKIIFIMIILGFLSSCGPHRMKCGPGRRCLVDTPNEKVIINKPVV